MSLRVFTYKVTFEEVPHYYWGVHKEVKLNDGYLGSPCTHKWMWDFYTPRLQVLEVFSYSDEGYYQARVNEDALIRYTWEDPLCLNEQVGGCFSLASSRLGGRNSSLTLTLEQKEARNLKVKESWDALETLEERRERTGWKGGPEARVEKAKQLSEKSAQKTRKPLKVVTPTGEVLYFAGLNEAARQLTLSPGNLCSVLKGGRKHTKGFTATYV
jgi:hypothetical protein